MQIIPVIDLKDNHVVYAQQGCRKQYQPVNSPLCQSSCIYAVLDSFLSLYPFKTFYIADLNAICGQGDHQAMISDVIRKNPDKDFWIDSGLSITRFVPPEWRNFKTVIGSESQRNISGKSEFQFILSLDFKDNHPLGPEKLFRQNRLWPENIIIMTLARVGSQKGPDFTLLNHYLHNYPQHNFIAAGGIRNKKDLTTLNRMGVGQALLSTALHNRTLNSSDIQDLEHAPGRYSTD